MRRHTMKQPSGPATSATPTPAASARMKKSSNIVTGLRLCVVVRMPGMVVMAVAGVAVARHRAICVPHAAVGQVRVVVVVAVDRQHLGAARTEKAPILRALRDRFRRAGT